MLENLRPARLPVVPHFSSEIDPLSDPLSEILVETLYQTNAAFYPVRHFLLTLFRRAFLSAVSVRCKNKDFTA